MNETQIRIELLTADLAQLAAARDRDAQNTGRGDRTGARARKIARLQRLVAELVAYEANRCRCGQGADVCVRKGCAV